MSKNVGAGCDESLAKVFARGRPQDGAGTRPAVVRRHGERGVLRDRARLREVVDGKRVDQQRTWKEKT